MPTKHSSIYDAVAEMGSAFALPQEWSWLQVDAECQRLGNPAAAWARLTDRFPQADLVASGIARQDKEHIALNPRFECDDSGFIVLRKTNGTAFDIVTAAGCVSGAPPVLKMLHDRVAQRGIAVSPKRLFHVTFCMRDTVILRSLGVAAVPAAQMNSMNMGQLQRLLLLVGGSAGADIPQQAVTLATDEEEDHITCRSGRLNVGPAKFSLVIDAASVSAMTAEIPVAVRGVARHLMNAERHLGFSWGGIDVWYPTPAELEKLRFWRRLRVTAALGRYFLTHRGRLPPKAFERPGPPVLPRPTLAATYFELLKRRQPDVDPCNVHEMAQNPQAVRRPFDDFVDKFFVRPLAEKALETTDPELRELYMEMACMSRLYHRMMPALFDSQRRSAEEIQSAGGEVFPREAFRQLGLLSDRLHKLIVPHKSNHRPQRRWLR